jgi:hypothetical protein
MNALLPFNTATAQLEERLEAAATLFWRSLGEPLAERFTIGPYPPERSRIMSTLLSQHPLFSRQVVLPLFDHRTVNHT